MALVGTSALIYRNKRERAELRAHAPTLERDLVFFLIFFALGVAVGAVDLPEALQIPLILVFVIAYAYYVRRTLLGSGEMQAVDEIGPLYLMHSARGRSLRPDRHAPVPHRPRRDRRRRPPLRRASARRRAGIEPLVLSLILAPLATELPEKANSFFWVREGKDALALGEHHRRDGVPVDDPHRVRPALTDWDLDRFAIVSGVLGTGRRGARLLRALHRRGRFRWPAIAVWSGLFAAFLVYVSFPRGARTWPITARISPTSTTPASSSSPRAGPLVVSLLADRGLERGHIVELGSGSGATAQALTEAGHRVLGIDASRAMVELARRRRPPRASASARGRTPSSLSATP